MHDHSNTWGIYNDVNNEWMIDGSLNGSVNLRYDAVTKLSTTSTGVAVTGTITATTFSGTATYAESAGEANYANSAGSVDWAAITSKPTIAEPIPFTDQTRGTTSNIASMSFDGRYIVITLENGASFGMAGNPM